jgi:putative transcriptional regulator
VNGKLAFRLKEVGCENRLEELRKQRGIRQEELATALEYPDKQSARWKTDDIIRLSYSLQDCQILRMSIEEIFIYEEEQIDENNSVGKYVRLAVLALYCCCRLALAISLPDAQALCAHCLTSVSGLFRHIRKILAWQ